MPTTDCLRVRVRVRVAYLLQHLLRDLMSRGLWTEEIRNQIIAHDGSVQVKSSGCRRTLFA